MAPRNTATRDRHRAIIRKGEPPCALCGQPIDYTLKFPDPMSYEVDHILPIDAGGPDTLDNKQPSHRKCNRAKWHRTEDANAPRTYVTTRAW